MGPLRKKSKPSPDNKAPANPPDNSSSAPNPPSATTTTTGNSTNTDRSATTVPRAFTDSQSRNKNAETASLSTGTAQFTPDSKPRRREDKATAASNSRRRTWYGVNSWPLKASPAVAQVARGSVSVEHGSTKDEDADKGSKDMGDRSPVKLIGKRRSSKGNPLQAGLTKVNVSAGGEEGEASDGKSTRKGNGTDGKAEQLDKPNTPAEQVATDPPLPPDPASVNKTAGVEKAEEKKEQPKPAQASGWRIWWSRPDGYDASQKDGTTVTASETVEEAQKTPLPPMTPLEAPQDSPVIQNNDSMAAQDNSVSSPNLAKANGKDDEGTQRRSWFWLWSSSQNCRDDNQNTTQAVNQSEQAPKSDQPEQISQTENTSACTQPAEPAQPAKEPPKQPAKSSGWAFWSRGQPDEKPRQDGEPHKEVGELAVADTPSQSHPEAAQYEEEESPKKDAAKSIRGRPKGKGSKAPASTKSTPSQSPTRSSTETAAAKQALNRTQPHPNLLLPSFDNTYRLAQTPSYWQQLRRYLLGGELEPPHLQRLMHPPRIKKALAIGVHGYFPAPLIQKVLGQPTGTSIRFANAAHAAIKEWTASQGYDCEVEKVALEGEGFIADRVATLWKLLLNWIEHVRSADFIMVACHSQGVPVAIMLVAKLIQFGCVNASRIGICAMAGVNLGPFPEFKTRFLGAGAAAELFEFSRPESKVSQLYVEALGEVLRHGVRVVYAGSMDDQLVSLESSTFSPLSHPAVYRAVFVDGRSHAPDFLTQLVGFVLKLRNLGVSDHGLIRELSPALAGSLYSGEGHSRIYDDPQVYRLAVRMALETTDLPAWPAPAFGGYREGGAVATGQVGATGNNPFFLPWAMRGVLEEEVVKRHLGEEVEGLLRLFEDWKPSSKGLRDVKFRLEGVRSKL